MSYETVKLSVGKLELPVGVSHALYVDDMRETAMYELNADRYRVRWDTMIDGWQYTVSKWVPLDSNLSMVEFAASERVSTRQLMIDLYRSGVDLEAKRVRWWAPD